MKHICSLILSASTAFGWVSVAHGQGVPKQPLPAATSTAAGPSMEQTIAFINERLGTEGPFEIYYGDAMTSSTETYVAQSVRMDHGCSLEISQTTESSSNPRGTRRVLLHLDRSDIQSLSLRTDDNGNSPRYGVLLGKAVFEYRPLEVQPQVSVQNLSGNYAIDGVVASASTTTSDGIDYHASLNVITDQAIPVSVLVGADSVNVNLHAQNALGAVSALKTETSDIAVGDRIHVLAIGTPQHEIRQVIDLYKARSTPQGIEVASFIDKDTAQRVAKALIHAMALCHKDAGPSLF